MNIQQGVYSFLLYGAKLYDEPSKLEDKNSFKLAVPSTGGSNNGVLPEKAPLEGRLSCSGPTEACRGTDLSIDSHQTLSLRIISVQWGLGAGIHPWI